VATSATSSACTPRTANRRDCFTMTIPEILKELEPHTGRFPKKAMQAAIEQREAITPELLRVVEAVAEMEWWASFKKAGQASAKPTKGRQSVAASGETPSQPRVHKKPWRNAPCPCGSGKKYKHCCGKVQSATSEPPKPLSERP